MKIKLTKIRERLDAFHHDNIPEGDYRIGEYADEPQVGKPFFMSVEYVNGKKKSLGAFFMTSIVTEIIDKNRFKTLNSVYKIERL